MHTLTLIPDTVSGKWYGECGCSNHDSNNEGGVYTLRIPPRKFRTGTSITWRNCEQEHERG